MPTPFDQISEKEPNRWYLAYGSNLSSKTFKGQRGVHPLASCNVTVPSLELTFDLPGIPYWEPCFANVRRRDLESNTTSNSKPVLTGIAYLITPEDYRRVIASEGGGVAYEETAVECWRIPVTRCSVPTRMRRDQTRHPTVDAELLAAMYNNMQDNLGERLIAYTLLAPDSKRRSAPMEPSKRYINIIRSGAREHHLPPSYIAYLESLRYYQTTGIKQKIGASLFLVMWFPILCVIYLLQTTFADKKTGRMPEWLITFIDAVSSAIWQNYERVWKRMIGSGEITEGHISSVNGFMTDSGKAAVTDMSI